MTDDEYKIIIQRLEKTFFEKRKSIEEAISMECREPVVFNDILNIMGGFLNIAKNESLKGKRIAVVCIGNPKITLPLLLSAIRNEINVKLVTLNYYKINTCIFNLLEQSMNSLRMVNSFVNYSDLYFEEDIANKNFDKIIYIGDTFDYSRFETMCNSKNILFWNDNNIKALISQNEHPEEYKKMIEYAYINNVELEIYEDEKEFISNVKSGEYVIIYAKEDKKEKILKRIKPRIVNFNELNFEDFKFKINDLILALDFSNKM